LDESPHTFSFISIIFFFFCSLATAAPSRADPRRPPPEDEGRRVVDAAAELRACNLLEVIEVVSGENDETSSGLIRQQLPAAVVATSRLIDGICCGSQARTAI
jgi:hypothetical protein